MKYDVWIFTAGGRVTQKNKKLKRIKVTMNSKVVLITGGSRGIGRSLGSVFTSEQYTVVVFSRSQPEDGTIQWIQGDMTSREDRERLVRQMKDQYGKLDVLINNAGVGLIEPWDQTEEKDLRYLFELNFFSLVDLTRLLLPLLEPVKGSVINTGSFLGKCAMPCMGAYCVTKFAVRAFSDSLRIELKPRGIHVLHLTVGMTQTDFNAKALGSRKMPPLYGAGNPDVLARKVYKAYLKRKSEILYPGWYLGFEDFIRWFPGIYAFLCRKIWKLN